LALVRLIGGKEGEFMKKRIVYEEDPFGLEPMQFGEEVELPALSAEEVQKKLRRTMRGEELRSVRLELGVTQKRMSELLGTSVRNVQAWESEQNRITGPTAIAVQLLEDVQGTEIGEKYGI